MSSLRFRYQTSVFGKHDIHFRCLRDRNQFEDIGGIAEELGISSASWPLFGMIWPSGEVLAQLMSNYDIKNRRILELGCGVGLASLVLNARDADITATDIHPCAESFLNHNTSLNSGPIIPFWRTSWEDLQNKEKGEFDLIIGSDVLYEPNQSEKLCEFIQHYTKTDCEVLIVEAGRGYAAKFGKCMSTLGFSPDVIFQEEWAGHPEKFKGKIHRFLRAKNKRH